MSDKSDKQKPSFGLGDAIAATPVLATIVFASYVIYRNAITPYDERKLLEWVLVLLGLLALGEVVERYTTLFSLSKSLSALAYSSQQLIAGHLADSFLRKRCDFPPFADRIKNAKSKGPLSFQALGWF